MREFGGSNFSNQIKYGRHGGFSVNTELIVFPCTLREFLSKQDQKSIVMLEAMEGCSRLS